ncbi:hypothetical protein BGZ99_008446 [Dissophora globulifera]|uniref:Rhodanese domain-containing protein n=1 Tax=Dissophora globulifera TaxID=979702 RepID=A0A9P6R7C5_9FUNG|nr:hypothetical protein BGZ99_008446 [Dissophora globulifera]
MLASPLRLARVPARTLAAAAQQQRSFTLSSFFSQKSFPALVQEIKTSNKDIYHISPRDLRALASTPSNPASKTPRLPPHIIDVRERHEIEATGTIPGAIPLPRGVLERDIGKFIKQGDPRDVVVYCAGGMRSILAAESLVRMGYGGQRNGPSPSSHEDAAAAMDSKNKPKVWSMNEGMDGWLQNGFEIEKRAK